MDNYLLLAIIALKGVCLFFCWKAVTMTNNKKHDDKANQLTIEEMELLQKKVDGMTEQNKQLKKEIEELK
ncbi:hypothetical protein [Evansella cellulosilytica]|uniref:Uncharacterized protein n=1 Tax=Evansella cellulosilytica (strain ATCC 21833 / DSM 2522 / FERM P-1141 / JCM 9156 / N-4) TaxID=649639 RepID=E6TQV4_EVAC2|nr:hypothetical protein [Evansella cellulosilytica]ADU31729.1 hypothetical protein Bcell_3487 [Evansella cellulosilytica DSM 2522]